MIKKYFKLIVLILIIFNTGCLESKYLISLSPGNTGKMDTLRGFRDMASDGTYLYIANGQTNVIDRITLSNNSFTSAWIGTAYSTLSTTGTSGTFSNLKGITYNSSNSRLYILDGAYIREISNFTTPNVTAFVGDGTAAILDGTGLGAQVSAPTAIVTVTGGVMWVFDNGGNVLRTVTTGGVVTTKANNGGGSATGIFTAMQFGTIYDAVAIGTDIYAVDYPYHSVIKIDTTGSGNKTIVAGPNSASTWGFTSHATGTSATFNFPIGITTDGSTYLWVADNQNNAIRKIAIGGTQTVTTVFGAIQTDSEVDGASSTARLVNPASLFYHSTNGLYIGNHSSIRLAK